MKKLRRILLIGMLTMAVCYIIFDSYWTKFSWREIATVEQMKVNGAILKQNKLPEKVRSMIDEMAPGLRSTSMTESVVRIILSEINNSIEKRKCKCYDIGYLSWNNYSIDLEFKFPELLGEYWSFGYGLENYSSPEDCFDFWMNHGIYYKHEYLTSLDELAKELFSKSIDNLDKNELKTLIEKRLEIN